MPHGLERRGDRWIAHSLGNFVFRQPGKFWAEHAIALSVTVEKADSGMSCREDPVSSGALRFPAVVAGPLALSLIKSVRASAHFHPMA